MSLNAAYLAALTDALQRVGVEVTDGYRGPWGTWTMDLRYGWAQDELMLYVPCGYVDAQHVGRVADAVAGVLRTKHLQAAAAYS